MSEIITLHIENLSFEAIMGILESERQTPQSILIEARLDYAYFPNGAFLNYVEICEFIIHHIQLNAYELIESALLQLSSALKAAFPHIKGLYICIKKPQILSPYVVGASIEKIF